MADDKPMKIKDQTRTTETIIKPEAKWLLIIGAIVLCFTAHFASVGASIRYGFLAVSFTRRGISGKVFGLIEGSIFFGYLAGFCSRKQIELLTIKVKPKWVVISSSTVFALCCATSGFVDYSDCNEIFVVVSALSRVVFGYFNFMHNISCIDILRTKFSKKFDLINGMWLMSFMAGHGIGEFVGTYLYDHYGYQIPFVFATSGLIFIAILSCIFLPDCDSFLLSDNIPIPKEATDESLEKIKPTSVTWLIAVPMTACVLINCVYAYLQVSTTPYLFEKFNIPLAVGGTVLVTVSAGNAIGSSISGMIAQSKICCVYTQMVFGAGMVAVGLLLMFPNSHLSFLYNNVPYIAYPAVIMSGMGDPIITIPALRAMTDIQTLVKGKCTGKQALFISAVWLMGTSCSYYSGSLVGGIVMEYITFEMGGYILSGLCMVSIMSSLVMRVMVQRIYQKGSEEERVPILGIVSGCRMVLGQLDDENSVNGWIKL